MQRKNNRSGFKRKALPMVDDAADERTARGVELTAVIHKHIESAELAFAALIEVHAEHLYLDMGFASFETYVDQSFGKSRGWAYRLIVTGKTQNALESVAQRDTNETSVPKLSVRAATAIAPLVAADPVQALAVVREAAETGQTVQQVMAPTKAGPTFVDPRGPEPAAGFARRMWATACRSCGHYAERHPRALCLDCQCQRYSAALDAPSVTSGDTSADAEPVTEDGSERVILGDMSWRRSVREMRVKLNTPETKRGIEELSAEPPKAQQANEEIEALITALREAQEALMGVGEPVGVEA